MSVIYPPVNFTDDLYAVGTGIPIVPISPMQYDPITGLLGVDTANATTSGVVSLGPQSFAGAKTFLQSAFCSVAPSTPSELANKAYVDTMTNSGQSYLKAVINTIDVNLVVLPTLGDRYIQSITSGMYVATNIYEYIGGAWAETIPIEGNVVYNKTIDTTLIFNGSDWVNLGISIDHRTLLNIGLNSHDQIDSHISTTTTDPHAGQDLRITSNPTFGSVGTTNDITAGGSISATNYVISSYVNVVSLAAPYLLLSAQYNNITTNNNFDGVRLPAIIKTGQEIFVKCSGAFSTLIAATAGLIDSQLTISLPTGTTMRFVSVNSTDWISTNQFCTAGAGISITPTAGGQYTITNTNIFDPSAALALTNTTASTSPITGALTVAGGIGAGESHFARTLNVDDNVSTGGDVFRGLNSGVVAAGFPITVMVGKAASSRNSFLLRHNHVADNNNTNSVSLAMYGGNAGLSINNDTTTLNGVVALTNTKAATSTTVGALTVAGGLAANKECFIKQRVNIIGDNPLDNYILTGYNSAISTGFPIGISIGKNNGPVNNYVLRYNHTADGSVLNSVSLKLASGFAGFEINNAKTVFTGAIQNTDTTESTTITNGAAKFAGGVGIELNLNVGGTIAGRAQTSDATFAPTGIQDRAQSTLSYNPTTRILTYTSTASIVWVAGVRYVYNTVSTAAHATTAGVKYYVYFNSAGLQINSSPPSWNTNALVATIYYVDATHYAAYEERHGCIMDPASHVSFHRVVGAYWVSGLVASDVIAQGTTDANNRPIMSSGVVCDDDMDLPIAAVPKDGPYYTWYLNASAQWTYASSANPFIFDAGTGFIQANTFSTVWALTALTDNQYVNYYACYASSIETGKQLILIPGQVIHNTLQAAVDESFSSLVRPSVPTDDLTPRYKLTFRARNAYGQIGHCRLEVLPAVIVGSVAQINSVAITNHQSLTGLQIAGTGSTYGHINDVAQTIAGVKTLTDGISINAGTTITTYNENNTFTTAFNGAYSGGTAPSTIKAVIINNIVFLSISAGIGYITDAATTFNAITVLPVQFRPSATTYAQYHVSVATVKQFGIMTIETDGTIRLGSNTGNFALGVSVQWYCSTATYSK